MSQDESDESDESNWCSLWLKQSIHENQDGWRDTT